MRGWSAVLLLVAGCSGGSKFQRPTEGEFAYGTTTATRVVEVMGPPFKESSLSRNGVNYRVLTYFYFKEGAGSGHASGIMPERVMSFLFLNDLLVGTEFHSSFEADHTDFDLSAASRVEKGVTRRAELVALLGKPGGRQVSPLVAEGHEGLIWDYTHGNREWRYHKRLAAILDPEDVVIDVTLTEQGNR